MAERVWTENEVRRIYREWHALSEHAKSVASQFYRLKDWDLPDLGDLLLPGWVGSDFPGQNAILTNYGDDEEGTCRNVPLRYLWETEWKEQMAQARAEYKQTVAAQEEERRDWKEYERLKAKFEGKAE